MEWTRHFIELNKSFHDRTSFDCGEPELNAFFQNRAAKHMKIGISRTMVLPATVSLPNQKLPICAFYSVTPGAVGRDHFPVNLAKKLPRYPVPVFILAQLAVHKECHGSGLGKITLIKALSYLREVNTFMPAYAIAVDCLTDAAQSFYVKYGFEILCEHNGRIRMFLPMKTIDRLFKKP